MSDRLVSSLVTRVEETLEDVGDRFPVYADPASGRWHATDEPEWNGGFWSGLLWLTAAATGENRYAEAARARLGPIRGNAEATTILRGFMFWYGAGLGVRLGLADEGTAATAVTGGRALAGAFVPAAGVLSPGEEDARLYEWPSPGACVDGLPGAVPLLALAAEHTGNPELGRWQSRTRPVSACSASGRTDRGFTQYLRRPPVLVRSYWLTVEERGDSALPARATIPDQ